MNCEKLESCPFYNDKMPMEQGLGSVYKKKYCEGNQKNCARDLVYRMLGSEHVPDHLYPNMTDVAERIIQKHRENEEC